MQSTQVPSTEQHVNMHLKNSMFDLHLTDGYASHRIYHIVYLCKNYAIQMDAVKMHIQPNSSLSAFV